MRAVLVLALVAICAVAVAGQGNTVSPAPVGEDTYTPAIMTPPSSSLKKPIIFDAAAAAPGADADAPLIGKPPANLKKSVVTEHIYGGVVEFAKGRTAGGCRCRKQLPEKFRYDTQFKRDYNATAVTPCGCPAKPAPKPEDALPPVIARLYPDRNATVNATAPCPKPAAPVVAKIAPSYYPHRKSARALAKEAAAAAAPCAKNATAAVPATITPSFYPAKHKRRARRAARRAARKAAKKSL